MPGPALGPCSAARSGGQACGTSAAASRVDEHASGVAGAPGGAQAAPAGGDSSRQLAAAGAATAAAEPALLHSASTAVSVAVDEAAQQTAQQQQNVQPPQQDVQEQAADAGGCGAPSPRCGSPDPQPPAPPPRLLPRPIRAGGFYPPKLQQIRGSGRPEAVEARIRSILPLLQRAGQRQRAWQQAAERGAEPAAAPVWQEFRTQQPAFDLADSQPGLEVFSGGRLRWARALPWVPVSLPAGGGDGWLSTAHTSACHALPSSTLSEPTTAIAVEFGAEGKRKFIATNCFWKRYRCARGWVGGWARG